MLEKQNKQTIPCLQPVQMPQTPQYQTYPSRESSFPSMQDVDHLVLKVLEVQDTRQKMHQLQEDLNWEKQNFEGLQGETRKHQEKTGHRGSPE